MKKASEFFKTSEVCISTTFMIEALKKILPKNQIKSRYIDLVSFASDAGFYHLVPKAVGQPVSEAEIISLIVK